MSVALTSVSAIEAVTTVGSTSAAQSPSAGVSSFNRFNAAYESAANQSALSSGGAFSKLADPLLSLNAHSTQLAEAANISGAADLRPGELLNLTMRSHEFMFHCQLVSNVANRSSDGLQQLFRQQS